MNFAIIRKTLGWLLIFEAIFMLVPTITAVVYAEWATLNAILASMGACLLVGAICLAFKVKNDAIYAKEGMVIVAVVLACVAGIDRPGIEEVVAEIPCCASCCRYQFAALGFLHFYRIGKDFGVAAAGENRSGSQYGKKQQSRAQKRVFHKFFLVLNISITIFQV